MKDNPFDPPQPILEESPPPMLRDRPEFLVGEAVIFWEKLRWLFNAIVGAFAVLILLATGAWSVPQTWWEVAAGAILANLCFGAGPAVSAYLAWFGIRAPALDLFLFGAGTALTMFMAYLTIRW